MNYTITIPLEVVNATHPGGYYELYLIYRAEGMTVKQAWEAVENQLEHYGLPCRYSTFESFRANSRAMRQKFKDLKNYAMKDNVDIA